MKSNKKDVEIEEYERQDSLHDKNSLTEIVERTIVAMDKIIWDVTSGEHSKEPIRLEISFYPPFTGDDERPGPEVVCHVRTKKTDLSLAYTCRGLIDLGDSYYMNVGPKDTL